MSVLSFDSPRKLLDQMTRILSKVDLLTGALRPPITMLAEGQSNFAVHPDAVGGDFSLHPRVKVWDGTWEGAGSTFAPVPAIGSFPFDKVDPVGGQPANSMAYAIARELADRTGREVYLILKALGSQPIESFIKPATLATLGYPQPADTTNITGSLYPDIAQALGGIPGGPSRPDFVFWMQGESNKDDLAADYQNKFQNGLIADLTAEGLYDPEAVPLIVGGLIDHGLLSEWRAAHRDVFTNLKVNHPLLQFASSDGLNISDGQHFTGWGATMLGRQMAALALAPRAEVEPYFIDGTWFPEIADAVTGGNLGVASTVRAHFTATRRMVKEAGKNRNLGVGGDVTVSLQLANIDTTGMTAGNDLIIRRLPFPARTGSSSVVFAAVAGARLPADTVSVQTSQGGTTLRFKKHTSGASTTDLKIQDITSGSTDINLTLTYPAQIGNAERPDVVE